MLDNKNALEKATVVLFNPLGPMRSTLREAVHALGFRDILDYGDLDRTRNAIAERQPDLVLLDLDREREEVCKLVREVRQARLSGDPFVVMMALSWHPSIESVNNSMEAGIDDIITMPISIKLLADRINALIYHRKQFVVTPSYVGPDRRSPTRSAEDPIGLGTIQVPNNLRFKAIGDEAAAASAEAIGAVQAKINNHRLNRHAQRVTWLIDECLKKYEQGADLSLAGAQFLAEIAEQVDELAFDLETQGYGNLLDICDSMQSVIAGLRHAPTKRLYELLRVHALATSATLMEREGAAELVISALNEATARVKHSKTA